MTPPAHIGGGTQRHLFDVPEGVAYLNTANLGPRLHAVSAAGADALRLTARPWNIGVEHWFGTSESLRGLFAELVNGEPEGVALVPSVSYGVATAAANLPIAAGEEVLVLDRQFPSNVYSWRRACRERGATLRTVRPAPGESWTDAVVEGIGPATAVVAVPQCRWTDGALLDLARIGKETRKVGAALVVDASQSLGAYPLDVEEIRPDFLVTVGYKWLLGPYGLGYLYVAPERRSAGCPLEESWLTRAGGEDFSRLVDYADIYRPGARRFDMGEFPQFILVPMAIAALEQILSWGVLRIQEALAGLTAEMVAAVEVLGFEPPPGDRVGHMVGLRIPGGSVRAVAERMAAARVYASVRGEAIRIAPHLHVDTADVGRLVDTLPE